MLGTKEAKLFDLSFIFSLLKSKTQIDLNLKNYKVYQRSERKRAKNVPFEERENLNQLSVLKMKS